MIRDVPVEGAAGLVKNPAQPGAVLNTDREALAARKAERQRVRQAVDDHQKIIDLEQRVEALERLVGSLMNGST